MDLQDLVRSLDLDAVYAISLSGERLAAGDLVQHSMSMRPMIAKHPGRLDFLFETECVALAEDNVQLGTFQASIVCGYAFDGELEDVDDELASRFAQEVAIYAAYPYVRQALQDIAARLGVPGLVLGLLKRGGEPPFTLELQTGPEPPAP